MSVGMTGCLAFMLRADGHAPWIADEVKIGRAVAPRPLFIEVLAEKRSAA